MSVSPDPPGSPAAGRSALTRPRRPGPVALASTWAATRLGCLALFVAMQNRVQANPQGDLGIYYEWASGGSGLGPAATLGEYPGPAQWLIQVIAQTGSIEAFRSTWLILMLAADAAIAVLLSRRNASSTWLWVIAVPLLGPISWLRLEMLVSVATVLALVWRDSGPARSAAALAVGTAIKLWPVVLVPALVLGRRRGRWVVAFAAVAAIGVAADVWVRGAEVFSPLSWQRERGTQVESVLATGPWLASLLGERLEIVEEFRSHELAAGPSGLPVVALALLAAIGCWVLLRLAGLSRTEPTSSSRFDAARVVAAAAMAVAAVATNKVFSPQYVLWFLPLVCLCLPHLRRRRLLAGLTLACAGTSQLIYPYLFVPLLLQQPVAVAALVARNVVLVLIMVLLLRETGAATRRPTAARLSDRASA